MPRLCPCQAAFRSKLRGGDSSIFRCEGHGANRWLPTMTTLPEAHSLRLLHKASHLSPDTCRSVPLPSGTTMVVTVWDV